MILAYFLSYTFFGLIRRWIEPTNSKWDHIRVPVKVSRMALFPWLIVLEHQELEKDLDLGHDVGRFWVEILLWLDKKVALAQKIKMR